jgi:ABC-type transporter Mla subunit MlaD
MFITGIIGLGLAVAGVYFGRQAVDQIGVGVNNALTLTLDSLATVEDSFALTKTAVDQAATAIATVEQTTAGLSQTIGDTQPLVNQLSLVASSEVPNSVEAIQVSLNTSADLARQVDNTLRTLQDFQFARAVPLPLGQSFDISFDLGIDYDPDTALDQSLVGIADSLSGVSTGLRDLEPIFTVNAANLGMMSDNVQLIANDIAAINEVIADINPLLDQYVNTIVQIENSIAQVQSNLDSYLQIGKNVLTALMIWLAILHLGPLFMGWELITGQYNKPEVVYVKETDADIPSDDTPDLAIGGTD